MGRPPSLPVPRHREVLQAELWRKSDDKLDPALEGVEAKLKEGGAKVAHVGCGHGVSTILMAKAYPNSKIVGFDYHRPSIEWAMKEAEKEGLKNITFEVAGSTEYPGDDYDLVAFFDCFHDMGNPSGAAKYVLQTLKKKNGAWMLVEPFGNDKVEDNLNPLGGCFTPHPLWYAFQHL